jgi:hypothetical protein
LKYMVLHPKTMWIYLLIFGKSNRYTNKKEGTHHALLNINCL